MANSSQNHKRDQEDVDDLMSSIMQGRQPMNTPSVSDPGPIPTVPAKSFPEPSRKNISLRNSAPAHTQPQNLPAQWDELDFPRRRKKSGKGWWVFLVVFILVIIGAGLFFFREPLLSVLPEPTLFSDELKSKAGFPLYFPTALPSEFKINTDSVQESDGNRIGYVITDSQGHSISVTLQKAIAGENPVDGFDKEDQPVQLSTPTGPATVFTTKQGLKAGIIVGQQTWVFVNMTPATTSQPEFEALLKSFQQG